LSSLQVGGRDRRLVLFGRMAGAVVMQTNQSDQLHQFELKSRYGRQNQYSIFVIHQPQSGSGVEVAKGNLSTNHNEQTRDLP